MHSVRAIWPPSGVCLLGLQGGETVGAAQHPLQEAGGEAPCFHLQGTAVVAPPISNRPARCGFPLQQQLQQQQRLPPLQRFPMPICTPVRWGEEGALRAGLAWGLVWSRHVCVYVCVCLDVCVSVCLYVCL